MLWRALAGANKTDILFSNPLEITAAPAIQAIANGEYRDQPINEIRGTGYVVASLEAALWCFWTTATYAQAILAATNLGDDADTTAAICVRWPERIMVSAVFRRTG
jgi:ADP-ribosyl-[dinitrogen reductase] hydrolase